MAIYEEGWLFSPEQLRKTASVLDGVPRKILDDSKFKAYDFMEKIRKAMKLEKKLIITNTAMTFLHRFYVYQSLKNFHWRPVTTACFFVALKVEETVVKAESLLKWVDHIKQKLEKTKIISKLDKDSKRFFLLKEQLEVHERIVLQTIGFDLNPRHCTTEVLVCVKQLLGKNLISSPEIKPPSKLAWDWAQCSFGLDLCLRYHPRAIACAMLESACRELSVKIGQHNGQQWWTLFDPDQELLLCEALFAEIMFRFHHYCQLRHLPWDKNVKKPKDGRTYFGATGPAPLTYSQPVTPSSSATASPGPFNSSNSPGPSSSSMRMPPSSSSSSHRPSPLASSKPSSEKVAASGAKPFHQQPPPLSSTEKSSLRISTSSSLTTSTSTTGIIVNDQEAGLHATTQESHSSYSSMTQQSQPATLSLHSHTTNGQQGQGQYHDTREYSSDKKDMIPQNQQTEEPDTKKAKYCN